MSRNQGRRPTTGKGGSAKGPIEARRLGLLAFGAVFIILFVVVAVAEGLGDPSVPDGDVAIVEQAPEGLGDVTRAEFDRALAQAAAQTPSKKPPKPGDKQYDELMETALGSLLDAIWIQGEAAEMGIEVSDKEIADELAKIKDENFKNPGEYKKFLKESGFTKEDIDERVKLQIIGSEIQTEITEGAPKPSQSDVEDYYAAAKATQFTQPETRDIRSIVNKDKAKAEEAKAALEKDGSVESWRKVAKKFSEDDLTKAKGGEQKGIAEASLEEPLGEAVFSAPEKTLEGPVQTTRGYTVFTVEASTPENVQELSEVESQIETQLEQQAQQDAFGKFVNDWTSRWTSRTFCADGFVVERCANYKSDGRSAMATPACYEANPKEEPEACPAPVFQLIPAMPGTVTPIEPRGKALPQRPIPVAGAEETPELPAGLVPGQ